MPAPSEFIFMLTKADETLPNAREVIDSLSSSGLRHAGFKDNGITVEEMHLLVEDIKGMGASAHLEVVSLDEADELQSAAMAVELGVDYLIGGIRPHQVLPIIKGTGIKYFPYVGEVIGHPAVLEGSAEELAQQARDISDQVDGINLLAYRHTTIPGEVALAAVVSAAGVPVISAGSIDSLARIGQVREAGAWAFTVGTAALDGLFADGPLPVQIAAILEAAG